MNFRWSLGLVVTSFTWIFCQTHTSLMWIFNITLISLVRVKKKWKQQGTMKQPTHKAPKLLAPEGYDKGADEWSPWKSAYRKVTFIDVVLRPNICFIDIVFQSKVRQKLAIIYEPSTTLIFNLINITSRWLVFLRVTF